MHDAYAAGAMIQAVFDEAQQKSVVLQGWAAIQNTSGHDWNDVSLTLATGAPLSFGVDLTRPAYASRPDANGTMRSPVATGAIQASRTGSGDEDGDGETPSGSPEESPEATPDATPDSPAEDSDEE